VHFGNGQATLGRTALETIGQVAKDLRREPAPYSVFIVGHTSRVGTRAFNKAMSRRRAKAVARALEGLGIPRGRIRAQGEGPDQPIADNRTRKGQALNRRVEIHLDDAGAAAPQAHPRKTHVRHP
jgi:outer membrane protein OmpA-like peptidoglycan-associated protein